MDPLRSWQSRADPPLPGPVSSRHRTDSRWPRAAATWSGVSSSWGITEGLGTIQLESGSGWISFGSIKLGLAPIHLRSGSAVQVGLVANAIFLSFLYCEKEAG